MGGYGTKARGGKRRVLEEREIIQKQLIEYQVQVHHQNSKIRRRKVTHPTNIFQTVSFFEEIKMNDIPFSTLADPGK